ncbi:hypothetical protein [Amycolatopsis sp. H20-H5]|uniref:hypothetical protein n=1 Tax=Amycolatopsis sp. H20-H5 TaxID=3046309 RepID=UPI002DC05FD1|nr:hypothetical protein [Amycolatopsis sp. H20-H5]
MATAIVALGAATVLLSESGELPAQAVGNTIVGEPAPLTGKLIVDADAPVTGAVAVRYTGSSAECEFLHEKYPDGVPKVGCVNVATFTSNKTSRNVQLCSEYSCDAWHASVDFALRYGNSTISAADGVCHYGGLAYDALKDWVSYTGNGTGSVSVAADFYVVISGIPITVEWHLRITNKADGSWHVTVNHT